MNLLRSWIVAILALNLSQALHAQEAPAPKPTTISVSFVNRTESEVRFFLNGGKGLETQLKPGAAVNFRMVVDAGVAPIVGIYQADGKRRDFPVTAGGKHVFSAREKEIVSVVEPKADEFAALLAQRSQLLKDFRAKLEKENTAEAISSCEDIAKIEGRLLAIVAGKPEDRSVALKIREWLSESHEWLAKRYTERDDFASARKAHQARLALLTEIRGKDNWQTTDARLAMQHVDRLANLTPEQLAQLRDLAKVKTNVRLASQQGKFGEALQGLTQILEVHEAVLGKDHPDYANSLSDLATFHQSRGDYAKAESIYRKVMEMDRAIFGESHPSYSIDLNNLAMVHIERAEYSLAEPLLLRALAISKATLGEMHPNSTMFLNNLAMNYAKLGSYADAEPLFRRALEIRGEINGKKGAEYASSLNNLGMLYNTLGDFARAEPLIRQAVEIRKQVFGEQHPLYATSLDNLGSLYQAQGDLVRAEVLRRQALEVRKKSLGEKHPDYATSLNNLALLYGEQREYAKADPLLRMALAIRKEALGEKHPDYASSLNNLAMHYIDQGDLERAEPLHRESLELTKASLGEKHPEYATCLNNLAMLYEIRGEHAQAEPLSRQALEIRKAALGELHPDYAVSMSNLARVYFSQGKHSQAEPLFHRALDLTFQHLELSATIQAERQQVVMAQSARSQLDCYLSLAMLKPDYTETAYAALLRWKGMVWMRQRQVRGVANRPELAPLVAELKSATSRLAKLATSTPGVNQAAAWQQQLAELTQQKEDLEAQLAARSAAYREAKQPVTTAELTAALPMGAVLVDFLEYNHFAPPAKTQMGPGTVERRLLAFVVRRDKPLILLDLGPAKNLVAEIASWRKTFGQSPESRQAGQSLREQLWSPLEPNLAGAKMVLLSPDGSLGRIPFAALPGSSPDKYLLEEWALTTIPVPQVLPALLKEQGTKETEGLRNLLLVGGVDYEADGADVEGAPPTKKVFGLRPNRGAGWRGFTPLEGTQGEVAAIEKMYRETFGAEGFTTLEKKLAGEERFVAEASKHKYLHVATHGFFAPPELRSALAPAKDRLGPATMRGEDSPAIGQHPSLLSGLALAGANREPAENRDDGILTAEEVQTLDLRHVELATLSACETGLGEVAGGEGVLGLQRAFQIAGARTTVTSLWKVDDTQTRALMERFYRNLWEKEMTKLEALREAQLWMLKEGKRGLVREPPKGEKQEERLSPYFWAAFVLSGDWR